MPGLQRWTRPQASVEGMPPGMLTQEEGSLLYGIARQHYSGHGEIVDAGAFLGASSYCLARGLDENDRIQGKAGRIHAYDLFEVWREQETTLAFMAKELNRIFAIEVANGESTLPIYVANVGKHARLVNVHVGDILESRWSGRPIEILFLDICKNVAIWRHMLGTFFRSLIPGISLVIHQDYHHPLLPFLHVAQERLASYFEIVEEKVGDSAVFLLRDRIPDGVMSEVAAYDFTPRQERRLMDAAIERLPGNNHHLRIAKAQLLRRQGDLRSARLLIEEMKPVADAIEDDPKLAVHIRFVEHNLFKDEADRAAAATDFDEKAYLLAHPDVRQALEDGLFETGFQHWHQHGRKEGRSLG